MNRPKYCAESSAPLASEEFLRPPANTEHQATPAVSVVIPTYNYAHYLPDALRSVMKQSFGDFEIVIIDDGSTDETRAAVSPFLADPRVHYHYTTNRGQPAAKNLGIQRSRGDLIAFLDADDLWLEQKLARQVALFRSDPALAVCYCRCRVIDPNGMEVASVDPDRHRGHVVNEMFRENFVCFSSSMVRRAVLDGVGLFGEEYLISSDYDLWLRIASRYRFDYVDEPLVNYRRGHASLSKRPEKVLHEALAIMNRFSQGDEGRRLLKRSTLRRSYAETYCHMAYFQRDHSRTQSAVNYLRAALINPISWNPWRGMMILTMPEALRRRLQSLRSDDLLR